ncbi:MAG: iron ABC transporter permease [Ectothiorhodospiraceae bacterium]|nr:iron ABC transporter permease [Ectothiorhodospiraceae bacterium]
MRLHRTTRWALVGATGIALVAASMAAGPSGWLVPDLLDGSRREVAAIVALEIRLPRTLLAILVGASLGLGGAALQGYLRNPLAEPALVGVGPSAALGAVVVMYHGAGLGGPWALPLGGLAGAVAGLATVVALAGRAASPLTLVLAGVAVNAFAGALISLALSLAPSPFAALEVVFWLLGSLADRGLDQVALVTPFVVIGGGLLLSLGRGLDALTLGEATAASLGFSTAALRWRLLAGVGLAVGASVAVAGTIGFVGLVVPHLLRPLVGHRPGALLAASAVGGALLTLAADLVVRLAPTASELKLGVVTALLGAPFFLHLLARMRAP